MTTYLDFVRMFTLYKMHALTNSDAVVDLGSSGEEFISNISKSLNDCKVFELDDNIKKLLLLTKTPKIEENRDLKLPYDYIFIDTSFSTDELKEHGVHFLKDDEQYTHVCGILISKGNIKLQHDKLDLVDDVGISLRITFVIKNNKAFNFCTTYKTLYVYPEYQSYKMKHENVVGESLKKKLYEFIINFLNFINNPEVTFVEHKRTDESNIKRIKRGKIPLPTSNETKVTGELKIYIDRLVNHKNFGYSHKFWVRGHFRTLRDERYKEKIGKRIWILPFIKGSGILINKTYEVKK